MSRHNLTNSDRQNPKVIGTGLIALDVVINAEYNREPFFQAGGTCGNVLSILSFLGWDSYPIARLNGDTASRRVTEDFKRWNLRLDYAATEPGVETPIIIHTISRTATGEPRHKFSFNCPRCGTWLPAYKPVLSKIADQIAADVPEHSVFFFDRVSRASVTLARASAERGAVVFFEPVSIPDAKLFKEALAVTHVLKYSNERFSESPISELAGDAPLLEIQTLGAKGVRYRSRLSDMNESVWHHLGSYRVGKIKDTAGAGDWCTAGIIDALCKEGLRALKKTSIEDLNQSLIFGQKLGAWSCQFEGARGGMYNPSEEESELQLKDIVFDKKFVNLKTFLPTNQTSNSKYSKDEAGFDEKFRINNPKKVKLEKQSCCF